MKIGIMITPNHAVPPSEPNILAPWHLVSDIADGLSYNNNNQIYLFSAKGSKTKARLYDFNILPTARLKTRLTKEDYEKQRAIDERELFLKMIETAKKEQIEIIHLHQGLRMDELIGLAPKTLQFVVTLHDPMVGSRRQAVETIGQRPNTWFVSISDSQRADLAVRFAGTVYNGINPNLFAFDSIGSDNLLFSGRFIKDKGPDIAINASLALKKNLILLGEPTTTNPEAMLYWKDKVLAKTKNPFCKIVPFVSHNELSVYYQKSRALLFPIQWEEPFGLSMIEAMACGTPVVAFARGSVPEIVRDGETGYIVNSSAEDIRGEWIIKKTDLEGIKEAIERIYALPQNEYQQMRRNCRRRVEQYFTVERMVSGYEAVYQKILQSRG